MKNKFYFLLLFTFFSAQCGVDFSGQTHELFANNDASTKDGGSYNPTTEGTNDLCETDDSGQCLDATDPTGPVYISNAEFDFSLSEIGNIECGELAIPAGMVYQAEIDKSVDVLGFSTTSQDSSGLYLFAPLDESGNPSQERTSSAEGNAKVCYLRTEAGTHQGSILVSFKNASADVWEYVVVVTLKGETGLEPFFVIEAPLDGAVYDERKGFNDGVDNTEGDILVNALGHVSESYLSILKDGTNTPIQILSDTLSYTASLNESGAFEKTIALPQVAGVYLVKFSADTNRNTTLSKTQTVIVAAAPEGEIQVKDVGGNDIATAIPTDLQDLIVGVRVQNLEVSGPNAKDRSVEISHLTFTDATGVKTVLASNQKMWLDPESSWCSKDGSVPTAPNNDYTGFDSDITFCVPLSELTDLPSGLNQITATLKNDLGETDITFSLIIDYNKPAIIITKPEENLLYKPDERSLTIKGTIKNFAGYNVDTAPSALNSDTGSYCDSSKNRDCPDSSLALWFNKSTTSEPIYLYPVYSAEYAGKTYQEINALISKDKPDQCREFTETVSHFSGDSDNLVINTDQSLTTTVTSTNADGTESTTVYHTNLDGEITRTIDGTEEFIYRFVESGTNTLTVTIDSDKSILYTIYEAKDDTTTLFTTNGRTGEISESSTRFECNIPEANFSITLSSNEVPLHLYTNVFEIQAKNVSGHRASKVRSFQRGETNVYHYNNNTLTLGDLGKVEPGCKGTNCVKRAAVMAHVSEGTLNKSSTQGNKLVAAIETILNDQFPFENLANGWPLPEDDFGNIDLEYSFKEQFDYPSNAVPTFDDLPVDQMQTAIYQGIHKASMAEKYMALKNLQFYKTMQGLEESGGDLSNNSECNLLNNHLCFFEAEGDPLSSSVEDSFDVALDSCNKTITSAFVPLRDLQYIKYREYLNNEWTVYSDPSWPTAMAGTNLDFNDFKSGKWVVDQNSINLKQNGRIDVKVCVLPDEDRFTSCDDDVSDALTPALKGTFIQQNLIKGGLLGNYGLDDFTIPMRWNVGKIILDLKDLCLGPNQDCDPNNGNYFSSEKNNILSIHMDNLINGTIDIENPEESIDSISLIPFKNCRVEYKKDWINNRAYINEHEGSNLTLAITEEDFPLGCPSADSGEIAFPIVIESNSYTTERLANWIFEMSAIQPELASPEWVLHMIWSGVEKTFAKILSCMDNEIVNPLLSVDNKSFGDKPYPNFIYEEDALDTDFEWEDLHFNLKLNSSDLAISDTGLTARLTMNSGVELPESSLGSTHRKTAFSAGHLMRSRSQSNLDHFPLLPTDHNQAYLSASINLEEIVNAASYMIFKKGPFTWLDVLGLNEIESNGKDKVRINAVGLAAFDICDSLAGGALQTMLPPSLLFSGSSGPFSSNATSIDLILDDEHPVTLAMSPYTVPDGVDDKGNPISLIPGHAVELKIGLTNVQASFKDLIEVSENKFKVGDEVYKLRFDAVLSLILIYHPNERKFHLFFPQNQNYHLSVLPGHNGPTYDDVTITSDLLSLFGTVFAKFEKNPQYTTNDSLATLFINLDGSKDINGSNNSKQLSVADLLDAEVTFNMDQGENGECTDGQKPTYMGSRTGKNNSSLAPSPAGLEAVRLPEELTPAFDNSDGMANNVCYSPKVANVVRNSLDELLCSMGIDDILIDPTLSFDYDNGYLHFGGNATIELEEWVEEKL